MKDTKSRVLIVCDNQNLTDTFKEFLDDTNTVLIVNSTAEAKECCEKESFHLLIIEAGIEKSKGYNLAQSIKTSSSSTVILVIKPDEIEYRDILYLSGADDYLLLPLNKNEVLQRVACFINNKSDKSNQLKPDERLEILSEIAASIAHDINTPLSYIKGYTEIIKNELSDEKSKESIEGIEKGVNRISKVISVLREIIPNSCDNKKEIDIFHSLTAFLIKNKESFQKFDIFINEKKFDFSVIKSDDFRLLAQADLLYRLWYILLLNSMFLYHTSEDESIFVDIKKNRFKLLVSIKFAKSEFSSISKSVAKKIVKLIGGDIEFGFSDKYSIISIVFDTNLP